jgi:hypothetical protein
METRTISLADVSSKISKMFTTYEKPYYRDPVLDFLSDGDGRLSLFWNYDYKNMYAMLPNIVNELFPIKFNEKVSCKQCLENIKITFIIVLDFLGWTLADETVYINLNRDDQFNWVRDPEIKKCITRMFESLEFLGKSPDGQLSVFKNDGTSPFGSTLWIYKNLSQYLFLAMCKTASMYNSTNDKEGITVDEFKSWLRFQSWIPRMMMKTYYERLKSGLSDNLTTPLDLKQALSNEALVRKIEPEIRKEFVKSLLSKFKLDDADKERISNEIEILEPDMRIKLLNENLYLKPQISA